MLAIGTATAYSSGYPALAVGSLNITGSNGTPSKIDYVVVAKFASGASGFTQADAEKYSDLVVTALTSVLPSSGVIILTPNQLTGVDADYAKSYIAGVYAGLGYEVFIFVDVKKAAAVSALAGQNIRLDIYATGLLGSSEMYLASVETAISYIDLLGGLLDGTPLF